MRAVAGSQTFPNVPAALCHTLLISQLRGENRISEQESLSLSLWDCYKQNVLPRQPGLRWSSTGKLSELGRNLSTRDT